MTDTMTTPDTITQIDLDNLYESPFNPRKTFTDIEQLAADIKAQGRILQPLLVRPRITNPLRDDLSDGYEIVFGHRRYRAAELAGLATAPCMVRALTDEQAKRAQISENLQRTDVHPIEEAEGYAALMAEHGVTADQLVEQTSKSRSYIYGRLALLKACPHVRRACLAGEIGSEVALLLARLRTDKLQQKALGAINGKSYDLKDGGAKSYRSIRELLREHFTLDLKSAIFDSADALLLPDAGACSTCPKRSANAPEFQDLAGGYKTYWHQDRKGEANLCTDPDCFAAKKTAHLRNQAAELEAKGKTVIDGNKARAAIGADGRVKGGYIEVAKVRAEIKKATTKPATVTIQNPRDGKTVEVIKVADLQAAGVKVAASTDRGSSEEQRQREAAARKKREADAALKTEQNTALLMRVRAAIAATERSAFDLRLVATVALAGVEWNDRDTLAALWGWEERRADLASNLATMSVPELTRLVMDCALVADVRVTSYGNEQPTVLLAAARHYGIEPTPADSAAAPDAKGTSAKSTAARARNKRAAGAIETGQGKTSGDAQGKDQEQFDGDGCAVGSDAQVDAFAEAQA